MSSSAPHEENRSSTAGIAPLPKQFPTGVRLGKDGKPCRNCSDFSSWAAHQASPKHDTAIAPTNSIEEAPHTHTLPSDCPPDSLRLGNHSWTLLHTLAASYPSKPTKAQESQTRGFLSLFAKLYPCSHCAEDFQEYIEQPETRPRLENGRAFGQWMCEAHNEVNRKLGKEEFDCRRWTERWKTGWKSGSCGFYDKGDE